MKLKVIKKPRVQDHLAAHFVRIAEDKADPAERFLIVAEESFDRLASMPMIGVAWQSRARHLGGIRFYPMPDPYRSYVIFYRIGEGAVEILAVLHGARHLESALDDILD